MSLTRKLLAASFTLALAACSGASPTMDAGTGGGAGGGTGGGGGELDAGTMPPAEFSYCESKPRTLLTFAPGQEQAIQDAVNTLEECTTLQFAAGTYTFDNAVTIRQKGITLVGAGKGLKGELTGTATSTVFVFTNAAANTNGVDHVGSWFAIRDLALINAKKDALRIESSTNVRIQKLRTEWAVENATTNGAYGIYPVKSTNVLVEDCEAYNAADAGIYVGQTTYAIVRRNVAKQNVAGIEIENTRFADVYENVAEDNTTGLVVFDLPGNPIAGTDVKVHHNTIKNNNRGNFAGVSASSSTVSQVPAGTGTFIMASRRVEVTNNTYENNNSVDVAVLSGLAIESDPSRWMAAGFNFASADIFVHHNTMVGGSGDNVDNGNVDMTLRPFGALIAALYGTDQAMGGTGIVDTLIWDGIDATAMDNLANDINLCFADNTLPAGVTRSIGDLNFIAVQGMLTGANPDFVAAWNKTGHYAQGVAPFNCGAFSPALAEVVLPQ
ncbi:MAG: parallel beta-helix domain-containing protein [Myxococcota bacterium]